MHSSFKVLLKSFLNLLYPPLCLHCEEITQDEFPIFCEKCLSQLILIDPSERCPNCFSIDFISDLQQSCDLCRKHPSCFERVASVFDYIGPAASLIKELKYGGQHYLAEGGGAYLTTQFIQLGWPLPDCIVPMPMASIRMIERGYNQSLLLAESLAKLIGCPVSNILKRRNGEFSQAGQSYQQRLKMSSNQFVVKKDVKLADKTILIIDDVMTTGTSLRCCAEALLELCPDRMYALTLCRAI